MPTPNLSTLFAALSDPTRRAILARLSAGEAPVKDLAAPFDLSGPAITKHLNVLVRAGLISRGREGQLRPCRLEPRALAPAAAWMDQFRAMWDERLDRLDDYLTTLSATPATKARARSALHAPAGQSPKASKTRKAPDTGQDPGAPRRRPGTQPRPSGDPRGRKT